jgi:hypothetical protein
MRVTIAMIARAVLAAAVLVAARAASAQSSDARTAITAAYARADAAYVSARTLEDLESIRAWLDTPDCRYADFGQPARRWAEMRAYAAEGLRTPIVAFHSTVQQFELDGGRATVTALVTGVAHIVDGDGRFGAKGAAHDVETTATVRDVWIRTDHWRRSSHTKVVANRITAVDGRPVNR